MMGTPSFSRLVTSFSGVIWAEFGVVEARSANEAIRQAAAGVAGRFVAVPARSWKPVTVRVEQTTRITLT